MEFSKSVPIVRTLNESTMSAMEDNSCLTEGSGRRWKRNHQQTSHHLGMGLQHADHGDDTSRVLTLKEEIQIVENRLRNRDPNP